MLKDFIVYLLKTFGAILVLTLIWVGAGEYQKRNFRADFNDVVQIRVRAECLRPEWIRTPSDAREYDLTVREMDLISNRMELLNRRTAALLEHADKIESLRLDMAQTQFAPRGVGGPAPSKKR